MLLLVTIARAESWTLSADGTLTISGSGKMTDYSSKEPSPWDSERENIKKVIIQNGITTIGENAFTFCRNLVSVSIPNSVEVIGFSAFWYCEKLASVNIPRNVKNIDSSVFHGCKGLISVTFDTPSKLTEIGYVSGGAFRFCSSLTEIILPDGLKYIGSRSFDGCSSLTTIVIPNSVRLFGSNVFPVCGNLSSITVSWLTPGSVTYNEHNGDHFGELNKSKVKLYVLKGTVNNYKTVSVWKDFDIMDKSTQKA